MDIAAVVLSVLALAFTILSFWWMNWRRGKLIVGPPNTYAAAAMEDFLIIQVPLVLYNDGAATRVVQNLRLVLEQAGTEAPELHFNNTVADLSSNAERMWSRQFAVEGRKSYATVFVFQHKGPNSFRFSAGACSVRIQGKLDKKKDWTDLLHFDLHIAKAALTTLNSRRLIPHSSDPDWEMHLDRV